MYTCPVVTRHSQSAPGMACRSRANLQKPSTWCQSVTSLPSLLFRQSHMVLSTRRTCSEMLQPRRRIALNILQQQPARDDLSSSTQLLGKANQAYAEHLIAHGKGHCIY